MPSPRSTGVPDMEGQFPVAQTVDQRIRQVFIYAGEVALANMTPEAIERALEAPTLPEFLLEVAKWIPIGTQLPDEQ